MEHHQDHRFLRLSASPATSNRSKPSDAVQVVDEDAINDVDEPPDEALVFRRQPIRNISSSGTLPSLSSLTSDDKPRQQSLLTQGLLTIAAPKSSRGEHISPGPRSARSTYSNGSLASTAELTSDGGLTSPARTSTPSPPLPPTTINLLNVDNALKNAPGVVAAPNNPPEPPRKRCITFACARPAPAKPEAPPKPAESAKAPAGERRTTLKFACPAKPSREAERNAEHTARSPQLSKGYRQGTPTNLSIPVDKDETPKKGQTSNLFALGSPALAKKKHQSEALRFHDFASSQLEDDEWTQERPIRQQKLTVSDTLKKEMAIRKLGEEAEAEALEEEAEEDEADNDNSGNGSDNDDGDDDGDDDAEFSDGGNETDDEEGFAASDDESEDNSEYQFWTPALTTAATSTEEVTHIRPRQKRTASESSIESMINTSNPKTRKSVPKGKNGRRISVVRPSTPELPDSTDFVCGTLDEDRPLEAAYLSCIEERKRSKRGFTPQDLDPSFPTSDPEQEDSDDEEPAGSESQVWVAGKPDESDNLFDRGRHNLSRRNTRSPSVSPKRKVSPAPIRRKSPAPLANKGGVTGRSPPPRKLFVHSPRRLHSPPPLRNLVSPPNSRKPSYDDKSIAIPHLAQRPHLTHTKSLPRTPNPFWQRLKDAKYKPHVNGEEDAGVSRGPIDIVQGLEKKRQRRKEKFLLTHCRHAKDKNHQRCQPGKGAQRMREVGLEMADRCRGYGQRLQLVLSV